MKHLLYQAEHWAEEVIKRISKPASEDRNNPPDLTRDIFEIDIESMKDMLECDEFDLVCNVIDKLIDEDKITFDNNDGSITVKEKPTIAKTDQAEHDTDWHIILNMFNV